MKNSRTSTNKKVINKSIDNRKNIRTNPSNNSTKRPIKKTTNNVKKSNKTIVRKDYSNSNVNLKKNTHSAKNNVRLNNIDYDAEYVPFFDDNLNTQEIIPNRVRRVEPDRDYIPNEDNKKKKRIRPIVILRIFIFTAILIGIGYLMFTLETFNLENIKVKGNEKYTENDIISKSNLKMGENIFKQLFLDGKNEIGLSYVAKSSFGYEFPNTIVITVKERYPAYIAQDKNTKKYYMIDNEGYLLEECQLSKRKDELLIEGLVFEENVEFGKKINEVYIKKIDIYNQIKKLIEKNELKGNITKVNFSNSLTIIYLDDKLKIIFANDSNLEYKVSFLKGIIQKNGGIIEGTIDMSIENPVYSKYD